MTMSFRYYYSCDDKDILYAHKFDYHDNVRLDDGDFSIHYLEYLAEEAAEDFFYNHDGWECKDWPRNFYFWDSNEDYIGMVSIEQEARPVFLASFVHEDE